MNRVGITLVTPGAKGTTVTWDIIWMLNLKRVRGDNTSYVFVCWVER